MIRNELIYDVDAKQMMDRENRPRHVGYESTNLTPTNTILIAPKLNARYDDVTNFIDTRAPKKYTNVAC